MRLNQQIKLPSGTIIKPDRVVFDSENKTYRVFEVVDKHKLRKGAIDDRNNELTKLFGQSVSIETVDRSTKKLPGERRVPYYMDNPTGLPGQVSPRRRRP